MSGIKEFKEKLKNDKGFREKFKNIKNEQDAVKLARRLGFEINEEEILKDEELNEDMLEAVAGGGKGRITRTDYENIVLADYSKMYISGKENTAIEGEQK